VTGSNARLNFCQLEETISALLEIQWWNWSEEKIARAGSPG